MYNRLKNSHVLLSFPWLYSTFCPGHEIEITSFVRLHKHIDFAMDLANAISSFSMVTLCSALSIIHVLKI